MRLNLTLTSIVAGAALGAGCSHQQKLTQSTPATPARVATRAPAPEPPSPPPEPVADTSKEKEGNAIYFDFDSAVLKDDARPVLQSVAQDVRGKQAGRLEVEGNCDELGTVEYNLALGEHRARAAKDYLVHLGVPANRISTVSYGSQRPKYPGHDDEAHAKNRRDDLVLR
jgi:peptidoglycan-associated lipoprotein